MDTMAEPIQKYCIDSTLGDEQQVGLDYPQLVQEVTPGNILLVLN